jgi:hypothetical protein
MVYRSSSVVNYSRRLKHQDGFHFMRRFVSYMGIILLALLLSGAGSTLAAALCPHAGTNQALPMAEDHSCCLAKLETKDTHEHHRGSHQQAAQDKAEHCSQTKPAAQFQGGEQAAIGQAAESCAHCVRQGELPSAPASVRELTLQKRDAGKAVELKTTLAAPSVAISVSHFVPSQHAPPGTANRKHLLLGVFLI